MGASHSKRRGRSGRIRGSNVGDVSTSAAQETQVNVADTETEVANMEAETSVSAPEFDFGNLSLPEHEPVELLNQLRLYSRTVSVENPIELDVLKDWIAAFYRFKGCPPLWQYREPCHVQGLENRNVRTDQSLHLQIPRRGPWSDDPIVYGRRKQKMLADFLKMSPNVDPNIQALSSPKRKRGTDVVEDSGSGSKSVKLSSEKILDAVDASEDPLCGEGGKGEVSDAANTSGEVRTPRERKKSKYLSPPFTSPLRRSDKTSRKKKSGAESDKSPMKEGGEHRLESPPPRILSVLEVAAEKLPDKMTFSASDVNVSVDLVESEIQLAALDPLCLARVESLNPVRDFVSAFRSSMFLHGSNYKIYNKPKTDKKGKPLFQAKSSDLKPCKTMALGNEGTCQLVLTFAPDYSLPSKNDIVELFSKFGSLIDNETNVMTDSRSVKIQYAKDSDAEAAYRSCLKQSPFDLDSVSYELQLSSAQLGSGSKDSSPLKQTTDELMSEMRSIQQNVDVIAEILENHHPIFASDDKATLKDDMKNLVESIESVTDKVLIMAEKAKSQGNQVA